MREYIIFKGLLELFEVKALEVKALASHHPKRQLDKSEPHQEGGRKEGASRLRKSMNNPHPKKWLDHWKHKKATPYSLGKIIQQVRRFRGHFKHLGFRELWYKG